MTIDDLLAREAIRDTMVRYHMAGDRLKAEDFAACFTEDGLIESQPGAGPEHHAFRHEGRAAIYKWQSHWPSAKPGTAVRPAPSFVRHHLSTCQIDLTSATTARVRSYWAAWSDNGPDHSGTYLDDFRREGDLWLIARRCVRVDWYAPHSLFGPAPD